MSGIPKPVCFCRQMVFMCFHRGFSELNYGCAHVLVAQVCEASFTVEPLVTLVMFYLQMMQFVCQWSRYHSESRKEYLLLLSMFLCTSMLGSICQEYGHALAAVTLYCGPNVIPIPQCSKQDVVWTWCVIGFYIPKTLTHTSTIYLRSVRFNCEFQIWPSWMTVLLRHDVRWTVSRHYDFVMKDYVTKWGIFTLGSTSYFTITRLCDTVQVRAQWPKRWNRAQKCS